MVELLPSKNIQRMREISDTLHARSMAIFEEKKALLAKGDEALKQSVGEGRDVMSILREFLRTPLCRIGCGTSS